MNSRAGIRPFGLLLAGALFLFSPLSRAQDDPEEETKGVDSGNYNTQQSAETGYRATWIDGNQGSYGTFVNLNSGLRLFDYTLSTRSLNHNGTLFDGLYFSNFGYGGDPNNVSRLRIDKNEWYDLQVMFRRDQNFWKDRKSTRLNSSHGYISYAVFCLKKKKKINNAQHVHQKQHKA